MPLSIPKPVLSGLVSLCVLTGMLISSTPASATAPEVPETTAATRVTATTATLNGVLNPKAAGEAGEYAFLYEMSATECAVGAMTPEPAGIALGLERETVAPVEITGLQSGMQYTFCLMERNGAGETAVGLPLTFTTLIEEPPTIESEAVRNVSGDAADLNAEVNPGGSETTYHFEYGTSTSYGQSTPESASIGGDDTTHEVSPTHIQGLQPATVYHYRIVATNSKSAPGGTLGADQTFTTEPLATPFALPDGRRYELVSPPNKDGGEVELLSSSGKRMSVASTDGTKVVYMANIPFAKPTAYGNDVQILSERGSQGWSSQDISPTHSGPTKVAAGQPQEFSAFSADLTRAVVKPFGPTSLSPLALEGYTIDYLRDNLNGGYQPLLTVKPQGVIPEALHMYYTSATRDLSRIVLQSEQGLTEDTGPTEATATYANLYEWHEGQLQLISVAPDGVPVNGAVFAAMSEDGLHILWAERDGSLFVRDLETQETVSVGSESRTIPEPWEDVISKNGQKAFFVGANRQINEFDLDSASPRPVQVSNIAEASLILGVSVDGSYVYYTDRFGHVYVSHEDGNTWVSTLISGSDVATGGSLHTTASEPPYGEGDNYPEASVTANGRYMAFTSASSAGVDEVYLYDASTNHLICTSCNPTGAQSSGGSQLAYLYEDGHMFFDSNEALVAHDTNGLRDVYEWEPEGSGSCEDAPGCVYLISSGTSAGESTFLGAGANGSDVFFRALDRLVSQDIDNNYDVYDAHVCTEAEPCPSSIATVPGCTSSDACKAPPSPQPAIFGAPPTATFSGAGNVVQSKPVVAAKQKAKKKSKKHGKAKAKKRKKKAKKVRSKKSLSTRARQ